MTNNLLNDNDDSLNSNIFGTHTYKAASPQKKDFLPWHRPRKQYVRSSQWCEQIGRILDESTRDNKVLKYFGLPGNDLLDIRHIHNLICQPRQIQLSFLGFNSAVKANDDGQVEFDVSLDEVRKLPHINPESEIIGDDYCSISNTESIAWTKTHKLGPYDVVNLDLCDGFAKSQPGVVEENHYNAILQLLTIQAKHKYPWLLLLTTRVGKKHINPEVLKKLLDKYIHNLTNHTNFRDESIKNLNIKNEKDIFIAKEKDDELLKIFLISIFKWFASLAIECKPPFKSEMKSIIGYKVFPKANEIDLISMAIKFDPTFTPNIDPTGLAKHIIHHPDECAIAISAFPQINKIENADNILIENESIRNRMIEEMKNLLELARYDGNEYQIWAEKSFI